MFNRAKTKPEFKITDILTPKDVKPRVYVFFKEGETSGDLVYQWITGESGKVMAFNLDLSDYTGLWNISDTNGDRNVESLVREGSGPWYRHFFYDLLYDTGPMDRHAWQYRKAPGLTIRKADSLLSEYRTKLGPGLEADIEAYLIHGTPLDIDKYLHTHSEK